MADSVVVSSNFSPTLVGMQKTDIGDPTLLTGNNFPISLAFAQEVPKAGRCNFSSVPSKESPLRVDDFFGLDMSNPLNYNGYGSTLDFFITEIDGIYASYPYSVYFPSSGFVSNILSYSFDPLLGVSTFRVPALSATIYDDTIASKSRNSTVQRNNIIDSFMEYELLYGGVRYTISDVDAPIRLEAGQYFTFDVLGDPFGITGGTGNADFHIAPVCEWTRGWYSGLSDFQRHILQGYEAGASQFELTIPFEREDGTIFYNRRSFSLPFSDGFNPDQGGALFESFIGGMTDAGGRYDTFRTDLYYRCLVPESLKAMNEDPEGNMKKLLRSFGRVFDAYTKAIRSVANAYSIDYGDKSNGAPLSLIPELSKLFGVRYFDIFNDLPKLFESNCDQEFAQLNPRLWKNILINMPFLMGSKGSRGPVEFIFRYMGLDECFYVFDEHTYTFDRPISLLGSPGDIDIRLPSLPYNSDGEPTALEGRGLHFQSADYFDVYLKAGYTFDFTIDNTKSYAFQDPLVANSKEVSVGVDPFKALECEVWKMNMVKLYEDADCEDVVFDLSPDDDVESDANIVFAEQPDSICEPDCDDVEFAISVGTESDASNTALLTQPFYPLDVDARDLTLQQYISLALQRYINPRNRKVACHYPSLRKIFLDYYRNYRKETCLTGTTYGTREAFSYIECFDMSFMLLVRQMLPATTVRIADGMIVRNTAFHREKHCYKRGLDESSLFGRPLDAYAADVEARIPEPYRTRSSGFSRDASIIGSSGALSCDAPLSVDVEGVSARQGEISPTVYWQDSGLADTEYFVVERLEASKCEDCEFELISNGEILPPEYAEEEEWEAASLPLTPDTEMFTDRGSVFGKSYFYRVKAYNQCGETTSNVLFYENQALRPSIEYQEGATLTGIQAFFWEITSYDTTPDPGTFERESGYVFRLRDGKFYPAAGYDPNTGKGTLENTQRGYREGAVPGGFACGEESCPNIFRSSLKLDSTDAEVEII